MFKTKGGGGQRLFEQCSKKLRIWRRMAPLRGTSTRGTPSGGKKFLLGRPHCCRCHFTVADVTALLVSALVRCTALVITLWLFAGLCNVPDYEHTVAEDAKILITYEQRGTNRQTDRQTDRPLSCHSTYQLFSNLIYQIPLDHNFTGKSFPSYSDGQRFLKRSRRLPLPQKRNVKLLQRNSLRGPDIRQPTPRP